jgi:hypothetical protein
MRGVTRSLAAILMSMLLSACAPSAPSMADAAEAAVRVDVDPATLVAAGQVIVGVRADRSTAYVVAFTQDGGSVATQVVASSSPVEFAANHVHLAGGPVDGSVLWGTADPTVQRVVVAHEGAVGGRVIDGLWVVVVPGVENPLPLEWTFVRGDGSVAASGSGPASAPDGPPPLNELEVAVIDALAVMGLEGWQVEHSFGDAAIWVRIDNSRQLLVNGYTLERDQTPFSVEATRRSRGVEVELGAGTSGGPLHRFRCGDARYYVFGTPPPPFVNLNDVVDAFIVAVNCAAAP